MSKLADGISVRARFARSANLERDLARSEPLDGYVVTARALDVVEANGRDCRDGDRRRSLVADPVPTVQASRRWPCSSTPLSGMNPTPGE